MREWGEAKGAALSGFARLEVSLQGKTPDAVVIDDISLVVDSRAAGAPSIQLINDICGGETSDRGYSATLDDENPKLRPNGDSPDFRSQRLKVSNADPEVLVINLTSYSQDVLWHIEMPWHSIASNGIARLPNDGGSYKLMAKDGGTTVYLSNAQGKWDLP